MRVRKRFFYFVCNCVRKVERKKIIIHFIVVWSNDKSISQIAFLYTQSKAVKSELKRKSIISHAIVIDNR